MKTLLLITILHAGTSCNPAPVKTINNDKQLSKIMDSITSKKDTPAVKKIDLKQAKQNPIKNNLDTTQKTAALYEDSIEIAISNAFKEAKISPLQDALNQLKIDTKMDAAHKIYWESYLDYYISIFYKNVQKNDDKASEYIDKAISQLGDNLKTTEDNALYAACLSFSIQFANMTKISGISASVNEYANKALALNPKNVRAYYVISSQSFYTPKMFGGMTKVEEYAIKGIACPNTLNEGYYEPNWGKSKLFDILIKYYEGENRIEDANKTKAIAKKEFPDNF